MDNWVDHYDLTQPTFVEYWALLSPHITGPPKHYNESKRQPLITEVKDGILKYGNELSRAFE